MRNLIPAGLIVLGCAGAWLLWRAPGAPPDPAPTDIQAEAGRASASPLAPGVSRPGAPVAPAIDTTNASRAPLCAETAAVLVAQVDESDRCIDPAGTALVLRDAETGAELEATISAEGRALFEGVTAGARPRTYVLETKVPGRRVVPGTFEASAADFEGDPPAMGISLALIHVHALAGKVLDEATRAPIEGAEVRVDSALAVPARTGVDGTFEVNLPESRGAIVVRAEGFQDQWWTFPEERGDGSTLLPESHDFRLARDPVTAFLSVRATLPDGKPAAGARLDVRLVRGAAVPADRIPDVAAYLESLAHELDALGPARDAADDGPVVELDARGEARLKLLVPGTYLVGARSGRALGRAEVEVAPGGDSTREIQLLPGIDLCIAVRCEGAAAPFAVVGVQPDDGPRVVWTMDADGQRCIGTFVPGTRLRIGAARSVPARSKLDVFLAETLELPSEGGQDAEGRFVHVMEVFTGRRTIEGTLVDARSGASVSGARAEGLERVDGAIEDAGSGAFRLTFRRDGPVVLRAPGYDPAILMCAGPTRVLPPVRLLESPEIPGAGDSEIAGICLAADRGDAARGVRVEWIPDGSLWPVRETDCDAAGRFVLSRLPAGPGRLRARSRFLGTERTLHARASERLEVVIAMRPLEDVAVRFADPGAGTIDPAWIYAQPGGVVDGERFIVSVPLGESLRLYAAAPGLLPAWFDVRGGGPAPRVLAFPP